MPRLTRYVMGIVEKRIYREPPWAPRRITKGMRYDVWLSETRGGYQSDSVYTLDDMRASLCLRAKETGQAITVGTRQTRWGDEIVTVELAQPEELRVS